MIEEFVRNEIEKLKGLGGNDVQIATILASDLLRKAGTEERNAALGYIVREYPDIYSAINTYHPHRLH
jgi:hypothetical protein